MKEKRLCECGADISHRVKKTKYCLSCSKQRKKNATYIHTSNLKILKEKFAVLLARNEKLTKVVEFYANPKHWTIDWIEGSQGDYGSRAQEALKDLEGGDK